MTPEELANLRRLMEAATPGEWVYRHRKSGDGWIVAKGARVLRDVIPAMAADRHDADLIVALVNAGPALLAAVEAAQALDAQYLGGVRAYVAGLEREQRDAVLREQQDAEDREAFARRVAEAVRVACDDREAAVFCEGVIREVALDAIIEACRRER